MSRCAQKQDSVACAGITWRYIPCPQIPCHPRIHTRRCCEACLEQMQLDAAPSASLTPRARRACRLLLHHPDGRVRAGRTAASGRPDILLRSAMQAGMARCMACGARCSGRVRWRRRVLVEPASVDVDTDATASGHDDVPDRDLPVADLEIPSRGQKQVRRRRMVSVSRQCLGC
jgi:hypothetical protein